MSPIDCFAVNRPALPGKDFDVLQDFCVGDIKPCFGYFESIYGIRPTTQLAADIITRAKQTCQFDFCVESTAFYKALANAQDIEMLLDAESPEPNIAAWISERAGESLAGTPTLDAFRFRLFVITG